MTFQYTDFATLEVGPGVDVITLRYQVYVDISQENEFTWEAKVLNIFSSTVTSLNFNFRFPTEVKNAWLTAWLMRNFPRVENRIKADALHFYNKVVTKKQRS